MEHAVLLVVGWTQTARLGNGRAGWPAVGRRLPTCELLESMQTATTQAQYGCCVFPWTGRLGTGKAGRRLPPLATHGLHVLYGMTENECAVAATGRRKKEDERYLYRLLRHRPRDHLLLLVVVYIPASATHDTVGHCGYSEDEWAQPNRLGNFAMWAISLIGMWHACFWPRLPGPKGSII
jgi:hypothetical protein